ncbi:hypothetical protein NPS01_23320 [Nocardioides psychrotolerans]|uniref:DUF4190 domain-containing protein n=1 Tax=Nocardioides psychrotolerans TaxID=1005945 RepID=A0A1I3HZ92_9ACTN|nr:DUF4190 domain-containing protein [Nocardioides psychrotolerans]GEP38669.1 hypothetical protein NPS01_23320 [Nocardioides psychrotolerans]SFI41034.1 protein of unknown function [Nocardioides psychrotolerans]
MANQGPPEPDETQPFASQGQQWPSYDPSAGGEQPPYGYAAPGYSIVQKNSTATTSMVLGIIAVVSILATPFCCITPPGMLTGPFAIWTGVKARREIDRHPGYFGNRGQAVAGLVTGIVATVLAVLLVIAVVVFVVTTDWDGSYDGGMY